MRLAAILDSAAARRALALARLLFGPVAVAFLAFVVWRSRDTIADVASSARPDYLLLALICMCLAHLVVARFTHVVLREGGSNLSYGSVLGIHTRRLPARYLPGGIWHTVSRMSDLGGRGTNRQLLLLLVLLENVLPLSTALLLGAQCFLVAGDTQFAAILAGVAIMIAVALQYWARRLSGGATATRRMVWLELAATSIGFWLLAGTAFTCYWLAFPAMGIADPARLYGSYYVAWASGFAAVFAPQGIGVFETVFALLQQGALPLSKIVAIAAAFRVVMLGADAVTYGVAALPRLLGRTPPRSLR